MRFTVLFICLFWEMTVSAAEIKIGDKAVYQAPVAVTLDQQDRGLMFVKHLPQDEGLLFDFRSYNHPVSMWMKDTYIPLDMLFIDCTFQVTDIYKNARPLSLKRISSDRPFCYVLEVNAGEADRHKIRAGDIVSFRL